MKNLLHLADTLLAEKGEGKGRNLNRVSVLALVTLVWWNTRELPDQFASVDKRLAKVEWHLGLAATISSTNAVSSVAVQRAASVPLASPFSFVRKNQNEN